MTDARLLGGRYEIGGPLGYGGMAEVHRGRDLRLGRDVAVKVLRSDLARDPGFQARFRREAQNAASLNHPAIVAVYDTGEELGTDNNLPFIVMEYVEGRTLKEVLVEEGRLMPQRAMEITADVCAALDFSHRNGIVHRDVKPGNVMMTPTGTVKVMDFGIARAITSATAAMTQTSAVIGTAQYLSPEQARGETVDARSDVYSTGCLLYELLCGNPPFTGDNPVSVAYQHVREDPIPPSELNPDVTPDIDSIVLKAMAKNPLNRYQSAGEMRTDLLRAIAGRPVEAAPVYSSEERTQLMNGARTTRGIPVTPVDPPRQNRALSYVLIGVGIIAVFALAAFLTNYFLNARTADIEVPNVLNLDQKVAVQQLNAKGLNKITVTPVVSDAGHVGKVVAQTPSGGEVVTADTAVTLEIGKGPNLVKVPDVKSANTRAGAQLMLDNAKLKAKFEYKTSAQPKDTILDYTPKEGTEVPEGSVVTVILSQGDQLLVPDVVDTTEEKAKERLTNAGFKFQVERRVTDEKPEGIVISQTPEQNTTQPKGTVVVIVVAEAPAESPPPTDEPGTSPTPSVPATPSPTL